MQQMRIFLFLGILALAFTSCKKDSNDFEGLRATINGDKWTAQAATGVLFGDNISITGANAVAMESLSITVPANITSGTYSITEFGDVQCVYSAGLTASYLGTSGELVITEHNTSSKRIKGTFSFEGANLFAGGTGSFTDGEFNLEYQ